MREFQTESLFENGNLALALAPALTPTGMDTTPLFFQGFVSYPQVVSRGLLLLADITATRYFNYTPTSQRDPVLTAQGDCLRAECFSACNGVYARLDLLGSGLDGDISFGTTNVDIGAQLRTALANIRQEDKLQLRIGDCGLDVSPVKRVADDMLQIGKTISQRPVKMPDRWVRALGNAAEIHAQMRPAFHLSKMHAQAFVASLPAATGKSQAGWLTPSPQGVKLMPRAGKNSVFVSGLHRLSALKRVVTNLAGITFYMPQDGTAGAFALVADLACAQITISLTAQAWQGYSGEGALLHSLAQSQVLAQANDVCGVLGFRSLIEEDAIASQCSIEKNQVQAALAILAVSGKLGFDMTNQAYFHRELPPDDARILKDNPRLVAAQKLVGQVEPAGENCWLVPSAGKKYRVIYDKHHGAEHAKCTCAWYLKHTNQRGPCKHILAVQLKEAEG